jgi:hypothetical protein
VQIVAIQDLQLKSTSGSHKNARVLFLLGDSKYQPEIALLRASPAATVKWLVCQIFDEASATVV